VIATSRLFLSALIFFICVFLRLTPLLAGESGEEIKVVATGLRLVAPPVSQDESVRAFNWSLAEWSSGTAVALLITAPRGGLVQFDSASSALTRFADDKGTDLLAQPAPTVAATPPGVQRGAGNNGIGLFPKISQDGRFCAVEVNTPNLPAKGASRLRLEGAFTLLCATEKTEHAQKDVPLKAESRILAPNLELVVREVGKPELGAEPLGLTLRASRDLDEVAEIRFYRADGVEVKSRRTGTSKMALPGAVTVDWSYNLADKVDSATVKVFLWKELRKKRAPFALDVDVGSF
jgi:hypothetical protein